MSKNKINLGVFKLKQEIIRNNTQYVLGELILVCNDDKMQATMIANNMDIADGEIITIIPIITKQ